MLGQSPPLLLGFLEGLLRNVGIEHAAAVVALATVALYGRHILTAGRVARDWTRVAIFASALLVVGLLSGIIPGLDLQRAVELGQGVVTFILDVIQ